MDMGASDNVEMAPAPAFDPRTHALSGGEGDTPQLSGNVTPDISNAAPMAASLSGSGSASGSKSPARQTVRREPNYRLAQTIYAHKRSLTALKWTSDGRMLVSAGADGFVHLFTMNTTRPDTPADASSTLPSSSSSLAHFKTLRTHRSGINDISLSPDDLYLATASDDCTARIFALPFPHLPRASALPRARGANGETDGTPAKAGSGNASGSGPSVTRMLSPLRTLKGHTAPILSVAFSPRSNLVVTGSFDESAIVWDVRTGTALKKLPAHSEAVWTTGWDREGGVVLTGSADGLVRLWDASSGQCLKTLDNESNSPVTCALFTPNPFYLMTATASPETTVRVYNIHTARVVKTLRPEGENGAPVSLGRASGGTATGRQAVVCAYTRAPARSEATPGKVAQGKDVDMDAARTRGAIPAPIPPAQTPDTWVLAGTDKGGIAIWDLATRRLAQVLEGHMAGVVALAVHPSGAWVASGSVEPERTIRIWRHVDT